MARRTRGRSGSGRRRTFSSSARRVLRRPSRAASRSTRRGGGTQRLVIQLQTAPTPSLGQPMQLPGSTQLVMPGAPRPRRARF